MKTKLKRRTGGLVALGAAPALVLAGCGNGGDDGAGSAEENGDAEQVEEGDGGDAQAEGPDILGILPAWTDGLSMAYLWQELLQDQGYEVQIEEITEAGPVYTAVADGAYHVYPSAWPERSEEHTSELQSRGHLVCRLLLEKKNTHARRAVQST